VRRLVVNKIDKILRSHYIPYLLVRHLQKTHHGLRPNAHDRVLAVVGAQRALDYADEHADRSPRPCGEGATGPVVVIPAPARPFAPDRKHRRSGTTVELRMNHDNHSDDYLRTSSKGCARSPSSARAPARAAEHGGDGLSAAARLWTIPSTQRRGRYDQGERCYASLTEVPEAIDMVDVFRRSEAAGDAATRRSRSAPKSCGCTRRARRCRGRSAPKRAASRSS